MAPRDTDADDTDWAATLTDDQYRVLREQGTERPFSGDHVDRDEDGTYSCVGCDTTLFDGETKFDAHCGWPSFWDAADDDAIERREDHSNGMERTEVVCAECGGHLGHVFQDGPDPTGERYCINSVALDFEPTE
ncbi:MULTISPECIES: peptide-methionine (R)-S-oxide reductase MsrB [Halobacterium]|uniref:peptide-methionine (R)-S-oxide reductase n=4 Tax=Halobacterium salinarum TaxID=2242 RepID=Q9HPZ3_HALSA|nr:MULTISPECIES: peptide-methionine (R)-S-oxide reductase MsrB [Halobacterium]AAG19724.1 transcription regulator [Halobacterium salinarum NRC-1]MBB6088727.1 peptide-methionine (R)-S-oxide reductase [Halobacterium salinarum]MCF2165234.1 peptide-methionine (R)-S-oxide reductase MsrB [Halobacterium salinarum]MCF2167957.1 peptide-methionine (R)-S-oxide reductase MsrB [Halobacterium salinarum]MCF2238721.1 peptide-methionine (R)-S-oxide reductase MsrB [Halobacterium salinarum]